MPGKKCPVCGKATFFGNECTSCGTKMNVPANGGKGGKGKKCPNCNKYTVFDGICNNCKATFQ
ncbi:MAG: hypothetical protein K5745_00975 [Saccharofermentans sp.]|nr:hypothetical protein [Saccharofermentans sp.]